jgi:hypothetical protein
VSGGPDTVGTGVCRAVYKTTSLRATTWPGEYLSSMLLPALDVHA